MKNKLLRLFLTFAKIGAFTFGGGYAMIPLIQHEVVDRHKWADEEEILDMFAIAESTPGVIAVNTATFIGYKVAGFPGALLSTVGVTLPAFLIIVLISLVYSLFLSYTWVGYAFAGIRIAVIVLILNAALRLGKTNGKSPFAWILTAAAALISAFTPVSPIVILLSALVIGIAADLIRCRKLTKGGGR